MRKIHEGMEKIQNVSHTLRKIHGGMEKIQNVSHTYEDDSQVSSLVCAKKGWGMLILAASQQKASCLYSLTETPNSVGLYYTKLTVVVTLSMKHSSGWGWNGSRTLLWIASPDWLQHVSNIYHRDSCRSYEPKLRTWRSREFTHRTRSHSPSRVAGPLVEMNNCLCHCSYIGTIFCYCTN